VSLILALMMAEPQIQLFMCQQIKDLLELLPFDVGDDESFDRFRGSVVPSVRELISSLRQRYDVTTGITVDGENGHNDFQRFSCYVEMIQKTMYSSPDLERQGWLSRLGRGELQVAAGIAQVLDAPFDQVGFKRNRTLIIRDLKQQFEAELDGRKETIRVLSDDAFRRTAINQHAAKKSRSKELDALIKNLRDRSIGDDHDAIKAWVLLVYFFDNRDTFVHSILCDKLSDEHALLNSNTVKSAPVKFVYNSTYKSGLKKGKERFLIYNAFRRRFNKLPIE